MNCSSCRRAFAAERTLSSRRKDIAQPAALTIFIEQLASELAGRVKVAKLNTDENPMTGSRFNVRSIPTLLVLKDGKEIDRLVGALPKQEIVRRLEAIIG